MSGRHEVAEQANDRLNRVKDLIEKQSARIQGLQNSAFKLAHYYFVSQVVVFTALAGDSSLVCHDVWLPLVLSLFPGFLNIYSLAVILKGYEEAIVIRELYKAERDDCITVRHNRTERDPNVRDPNGGDPNPNGGDHRDGGLKRKLQTQFVVCMTVGTSIAIAIAFGSISIVCREKIFGHDNGGAKCLKLRKEAICPKS